MQQTNADKPAAFPIGILLEFLRILGRNDWRIPLSSVNFWPGIVWKIPKNYHHLSGARSKYIHEYKNEVENTDGSSWGFFFSAFK